MISNSSRETKKPVSSRPGSQNNECVGLDLSEFDGLRMAVILGADTGRIVLRGTACFVRDDAVGNTLQIHLDDQEPGQPVIVIAEREWKGRIIPDFHYGCHFSLIVN